MGLHPFNRHFGFRVGTDVKGIAAMHSFIARLHIDGDKVPAASADGVLPLTPMGEGAEIEEGITNPAVPRSLSIVGSELNIAGNVKITGRNYAGQEIEETIALNAKTGVNGNLAFREITKVELPAETNTPQEQTVTIEATNECTTSGDLTATMESVLFEDGEHEVVIPVDDTDHDTAAKVAAEIVEVLNNDEVFSEHFTASNDGAVITITANEPDSDDETMDIGFEVASTGVTFGASAAGDAGILDKVSVGWGNKLGLPYMLEHNTVLAVYLNNIKESTPPTVAVDDDELDKNTVLLDSSLNGTAVDIYLIV